MQDKRSSCKAATQNQKN